MKIPQEKIHEVVSKVDRALVNAFGSAGLDLHERLNASAILSCKVLELEMATYK